MVAIFWKEVKSYFYSPIAYVLIGLFIVLTSLFFTFINLMRMDGNLNYVFSNAINFLIFIIPILTMRIIAEDRKNGTEVLLITSPASLTAIVVGKFLASFFVYLVMTAITFIYPIVLLIYGGVITPSIIGGYIGFLLLGAAFISFGIFASALTESQVIAAVIGIVSLFVMFLAGQLSTAIGGIIGKILGWFSLLDRYEEFSRGILGVAPVVYYLSFVAVFLFITVRIIEKRRWSQG